MKLIRRLLMVAVLLIAVVIGIVFFSLDKITPD